MAELRVQKSTSLFDKLREMEDRVLRRSYDIFRDNGSVFGKDLDHWLKAERELVWKPAIELKERDNVFKLQAAIAGVDPKNLKVEVTPEEILIRGETKTEKKVEKGEVYTSEFQAGSLFRSVRFPKKIDPEKVKAELKNGLLTVTAPVAEEAKAHKVEIDAA